MSAYDITIAKLRQLPESQMEQINDFIDFLLIKLHKTPTASQPTQLKREVMDRLQQLAQQNQHTLEEQIAVILENAVRSLTEIESAGFPLVNGERFWEMTLRFREYMQREGITLEGSEFEGLRDRSVGREVEW